MFEERETEQPSPNPDSVSNPPHTPKTSWQRDAEARIRDYKAEDEKRLEEKRRADSNFVKVYPQGWKHLRALITDYPLAAKMYAFLAENIDGGVGAVVVSQAILADELGVSDRTIRKLSTYLEERSVMVRIKLQGNLYAYALNPDEVWKSWKDNKNYSAFTTRTLAGNRGNEDVKRRLNVMLKNVAPPLPGLEEHMKPEPESKKGR